jgi:hypothetical protein
MKNEKFFWPWLPWIIASIVFLALLVLLTFLRGGKNSTPVAAVADSTTVTTPAAPCPPFTVGINISGDSLVRMYQEIARLQAALKACEKGKKPVTQTRKSSSTSAASNQTRTSSTSAASMSQSTSPMIATNQYVGDVVGDAGCSFDENSKLFFYVKTSLLNSIKNRTQTTSNLNAPSGPKGEEVGEYTYYKTPILILNDMLDQEWAWTVYVGNNAQYGYDMWLWHELIKLNADLKNDPQIQSNGLGGYQFISKINYHSR